MACQSSGALRWKYYTLESSVNDDETRGVNDAKIIETMC